MKVILNQDVVGLGEEGDIKEVASGYGRNYLLPRKLAVLHSKENLANLERRRTAIEKRKQEKRVEAQSLKERLEAEEVRIVAPAGENGKLFGSVNNSSVAVELEKKGFQIEKKRIEIPEHTIRNIGQYKVRIRLYDKEEASVRLIVEGAPQPGSSATASRTRQSRARPAAESAPEPAAAQPAVPVSAPAAEPAPEAAESEDSQGS
ncbi:MAG TPA: 50S ribosomal protein L9 [Spirochaetia bacterium]|nr:50S ribosomal protein L9 [Spirochaetia bacterium]